MQVQYEINSDGKSQSMCWLLNPIWHERDIFIPLSLLDQILSDDFFFSNTLIRCLNVRTRQVKRLKKNWRTGRPILITAFAFHLELQRNCMKVPSRHSMSNSMTWVVEYKKLLNFVKMGQLFVISAFLHFKKQTIFL